MRRVVACKEQATVQKFSEVRAPNTSGFLLIYLTIKEVWTMYYTVIRHGRNIYKCSQIPAVLYGNIIHGSHFFEWLRFKAREKIKHASAYFDENRFLNLGSRSIPYPLPPPFLHSLLAGFCLQTIHGYRVCSQTRGSLTLLSTIVIIHVQQLTATRKSMKLRVKTFTSEVY